MVKNEKMVSPEPFLSWLAVRRQRLQPPFEQPPRPPDLYVDGFLHRGKVRIVIHRIFTCVHEEKHASKLMFFHLFS